MPRGSEAPISSGGAGGAWLPTRCPATSNSGTCSPNRRSESCSGGKSARRRKGRPGSRDCGPASCLSEKEDSSCWRIAMHEAYLCDAVRTPIGRYGGSLSGVRTDDLAAHPIQALMRRNAAVDWSRVDDVMYGCANQAGEDNRNVARMAGLLAGLPVEVPGVTLNRLCGSGMDAVGSAARAIKAGEAELIVAGGGGR